AEFHRRERGGEGKSQTPNVQTPNKSQNTNLRMGALRPLAQVRWMLHRRGRRGRGGECRGTKVSGTRCWSFGGYPDALLVLHEGRKDREELGYNALRSLRSSRKAPLPASLRPRRARWWDLAACRPACAVSGGEGEGAEAEQAEEEGAAG